MRKISERKIVQPCNIQKGNFRLYFDNGKRFRLFFRQHELTQYHGLNTAFLFEGSWYDILDAHSRIERPSPNDMLIHFIHHKLPLAQTWHLRFSSETTLEWNVEMQLKAPLRIERRNASVFLSRAYTRWVADVCKGQFPESFSSQWQVIYSLKDTHQFIGMVSYREALPSLTLQISEDPKAKLYIQNTDAASFSRVLEAHIEEGKEPLQPGTYPYLQATLKFYPDKAVLENVIDRVKKKQEERLKKFGKPKYCFIVPSKTCMFKCKTCKMWQLKRDDEELTIAQWKQYLGELADFVENPMTLQFLGGEPLMKEGIIDLVAFATQKRYNTVLTTNAYLINEDMAKQIGDSGLTTIILSLHSLRENIHDLITGVKGSYRRLMQAIDLLHKYRKNTNIGIDTLILDVNLDELVKMAEWVNNDQRIWRIFFLACVQPFCSMPDNKWYISYENDGLWPKDLDKACRVLDALINLKQQGYKIDNPLSQLNLFKGYFEDPYGFIKSVAARKGNCPRGDAALEISPTGEVSLCFYMGFFGNAKDNSIKDLWYSSNVFEIRNAINHCDRECDLVINCPYDVEDSVLERT